MIDPDAVRAHVAAIGDLLDLPLAHPGAYERLDDAALREHVAVHLRAALEGDEVPTPPSAVKAFALEGVLADYLGALRDLTGAEVKTLAAAWVAALDATSDAPWNAAWGAAWDATLDATLDAVRAAALDAARAATLDAGRVAVRGAAQGGALALVVADLVGRHGLTRDHLDILTGPARTIPRLSTIIDRALPTTTKGN